MARVGAAAGAALTWGLGCVLGVGLARGLGAILREEWGEVPEAVLLGYAIALLVGLVIGGTLAFTLTGAWLTSRRVPNPWATTTTALALTILPLGAAVLLGIEPVDGTSLAQRAGQAGAWVLVLLTPAAAMGLVGRSSRTGPDDAVWARPPEPPTPPPPRTDAPVWERPPR